MSLRSSQPQLTPPPPISVNYPARVHCTYPQWLLISRHYLKNFVESLFIYSSKWPQSSPVKITWFDSGCFTWQKTMVLKTLLLWGVCINQFNNLGQDQENCPLMMRCIYNCHICHALIRWLDAMSNAPKFLLQCKVLSKNTPKNSPKLRI